MNASPLAKLMGSENADLSPAAHPLYAVEQVFLWLPGLPGMERPYCTYNSEHRFFSAWCGVWLYEPEKLHDENGAFYSPLFPINPETYICWHLHVSPPVPFHGVPIIHSLSIEEMSELARRALLASEEDPATYPDPLAILRNDRKSFILASLSQMGLLCG